MSEKQYPVCMPPTQTVAEPEQECWVDGGYGNAALQEMLPTARGRFDHRIPHEDILGGGNVRYDVQSSPGGLGVRVPIYAHGSDVTEQDFARMQAGIDHTWNEQFEICRNGECSPVWFEPAFSQDTPTGANVITDAGRGPTTVRKWQTEDTHHIAPEDRFRDRGSVELAAGHEFGHLIGNPDEYWKTATQFQAITGREPLESELTSRGYTDASNGMGRTGEPMLPRHLEHLAAWVEAQEPDGGTVTIQPRDDAECTLFDGVRNDNYSYPSATTTFPHAG